MKIIYSPKCLEYKSPGHPESPERIEAVFNFLKKRGGFEFVEPIPCSEFEILAVHSEKLLNSVKSGDFWDPDTPNIPGIFDLAKLSAGGAILAAKIALEGEKAFSLMRPPGHHASKEKLGGFCYFNNMAISIEKILKKVKKAAILDLDVHHGNGTQDIFLGKSNVLFISLHQSPLYPGTGQTSQKNCLNYPLPPGTGEDLYLKTLKEAFKKIREFKPEILGISMGFDSFREDPLANFELKIESYKKIGQEISKINRPTFAILEGGYNVEKIGFCLYEFLVGWH